MGMKGPDTIIWIFTAKCNLNCPHCYAYRLLCEGELSLEEKIKLIHEMGELGVEHVGLSGGEPLIHKDLPLILKELYDQGIYVTMVTNGLAVTKEKAEILRKYDVYVYVSVDGPKRVHEALRGVGTYDKVVRGISTLREVGVEYATIMAVSRINYNYVDKYIEIALNMQADHAAIIPVMPSGKAIKNELWIDASRYQEAIKAAIAKAEKLSYNIAFWCTPFLNVIVSSRYAKTYYCRISDTMDISPSGKVLLCDVIDVTITSIKNGLKQAVMEYYSSKLVSDITNPPKLPSVCEKCPIRTLCRGGCFARSLILYGDFNRGDPLCPLITRCRKRD